MSALDLDALEDETRECVTAEAAAAVAQDAFEDARAACRAGGCFAVWGRRPTDAEAALDAAFDVVRDAKHRADDRLRLARRAWERRGDAAALVLALITRLRAAEARTAWQPIETAPRGLPWVLMCVGEIVYKAARD